MHHDHHRVTYQHDLRHWIQSYSQHVRIQCDMMEIVYENWIHASNIVHKDRNSRTKRTNPACRDSIESKIRNLFFTSVFQEKIRNCDFSQNFDSKSHILVWQANRQNHQIMQKTACHMTIWKDHKNRTIWSIFLLKKVLTSPDSHLCSQTVAKSWNACALQGKSTFVKFRSKIGSANIEWKWMTSFRKYCTLIG